MSTSTKWFYLDFYSSNYLSNYIKMINNQKKKTNIIAETKKKMKKSEQIDTITIFLLNSESFKLQKVL